MTIYDFFDVKIVFFGHNAIYEPILSHMGHYILVNIFKKIRNRKNTLITKNATSHLIIDHICQFFA
jgi:hypothetical protein